MLVLSRKIDESIVIGDNIVVKIVGNNGDKVRIGITAPGDVPVYRQEIYDAIKRNEGNKEATEAKTESQETTE